MQLRARIGSWVDLIPGDLKTPHSLYCGQGASSDSDTVHVGLVSHIAIIEFCSWLTLSYECTLSLSAFDLDFAFLPFPVLVGCLWTTHRWDRQSVAPGSDQKPSLSSVWFSKKLRPIHQGSQSSGGLWSHATQLSTGPVFFSKMLELDWIGLGPFQL